MAVVTVTIPKMLANLVRSGRELRVEAATVRGALDAICDVHPELTVHIFDESGAMRQHVSCFHNSTTVLDLSEPVEDDDTVLVLQAVSGG
jgi:sulfur-carrier protein